VNNGKFTIKDNQLVFIGSGEVIPEDEPVFILRACDRQASSILRVYQSKMRPTDPCWKGIQAVIEEFTRFRKNNPDKMKQPDEAYAG